MTAKHSRFELEWWIVQKRMIYIVIGISLLSVLACAVGAYVWMYGSPFKRMTSDPVSAGARFISFEGDVRVIRSSTRETVMASSRIQLYPGDTVQTQADGRAKIGLADGSTLLVRPNSTVVIRDNTNSEGGRPSQVRVQVGSG